MKRGFLKPLRYISQMFDGKEHEMQIGFPTDVKHVAHIGWDGPNVNAPSWMKEFHSAPIGKIGPDGTPWGSQEFNIQAEIEDNPSGEMMPRRSRRSGEPTVRDSPNNIPRHRHSRQYQSEGTVSVNSSNHELPSDGSRKGSRRLRKKDGNSVAAASRDLPAIPRQSRRKSKGSSSSSVGSGDSIRASRSKNPALASDIATQERDTRSPSPQNRKPAVEGKGYLI